MDLNIILTIFKKIEKVSKKKWLILNKININLKLN